MESGGAGPDDVTYRSTDGLVVVPVPGVMKLRGDGPPETAAAGQLPVGAVDEQPAAGSRDNTPACATTIIHTNITAVAKNRT